MIDFINQSLTPAVFWTALASIGTLLAVLVALFSPTMAQRRRDKRIEKLIKAEIDGNLKIIRNMTSGETQSLPDGTKISASIIIEALVTHIDLRLWHQYRYELTVSQPSSYDKLHSVNRYAEAIKDALKEPPEMRLALQISEAGSFVKAYNENFK